MKRIVTILIAILLLVAVPLSVFLVMKNQELRKKASPATTLTMVPSSVSKSVGEEFTLEARMNTADNQIVAVELNIAYDPTVLQADWIHNGTMFPNILTSGVIENGIISIALGATNTTTPITGTGTVATIKFTTLAATTSPVSVRFAQDTFVGALNEGSTNALTSSTPATVTIGGGQQINSTPTPTPTGSIAPTPTGTIAPQEDEEATASAISINSPTENESVSSDQPTVEGKAPPGSTVTIVIYSNEITATVLADTQGNWSYTLEEPLESGPHTIVVATQDPITGTSHTATLAFVVANGDENGSNGYAVPVSGTIENTILFLGMGVFFIFVGAFIPLVKKRTL